MNAREQISPEEAAALLQRPTENLAHLANIRLQVVVELGRKDMPLSEVLNLKPQDYIELDKLAGEAFQVRVNDHAFAEGEIVVVTDIMAFRVTRLYRPQNPLASRQPPEATVLAEEVAEERIEEEGAEDNGRDMKFIPAGAFVMGGRDEDSPSNERPSHTVYLSDYFISTFPVTNLDYLEFVQATGHRTPIHWQRGTFPTGTAQHPVTNVSWQDAMAYAEWRGARLPTEAEWEKAARGTDERPYPWGSRFVEGERCNSNNMIGTTTPVDEFPDGKSFYGLYDMAGNVYEWCADYYDEEYYRTSPPADPPGPEGGQERVIRGGSFSETRAGVRCTHRAGASETQTRDKIGFRLAMDA